MKLPDLTWMVPVLALLAVSAIHLVISMSESIRINHRRDNICQ
jgi:hypothetical protein